MVYKQNKGIEKIVPQKMGHYNIAWGLIKRVIFS